MLTSYYIIDPAGGFGQDGQLDSLNNWVDTGSSLALQGDGIGTVGLHFNLTDLRQLYRSTTTSSMTLRFFFTITGGATGNLAVNLVNLPDAPPFSSSLKPGDPNLPEVTVATVTGVANTVSGWSPGTSAANLTLDLTKISAITSLERWTGHLSFVLRYTGGPSNKFITIPSSEFYANQNYPQTSTINPPTIIWNYDWKRNWIQSTDTTSVDVLWVPENINLTPEEMTLAPEAYGGSQNNWTKQSEAN